MSIQTKDTLSDDEIRRVITDMGQRARQASRALAVASTEEKNTWLTAMADALEAHQDQILSANAEDMAEAKQNGLSSAMLDRLQLTPERLHGMADAIRHVVTLPDPVGRVLSRTERPNGLKIEKISVPIGVIGFIYESRPNVTSDAASLCLKAGNAVILRGGSEALRSNLAVGRCISEAGTAAGMPEGAVQIVSLPGHRAVTALVKLDSCINLIIPRGGERLIRTIVEQSTIPVIKHYKGVCHIFADASCDQERALDIIENAKCQRPGVCNALETLLIHQDIAKEFAPKLAARMKQKNVLLRGDEAFRKLSGDPAVEPATEDDWYTEYMALILSVRIVSGLDEAIEHINHYGSGHSDSILTSDPEAAERFLSRVDSAAVYHNASTRFTDGGEFGMGAEIGISTDKLHARGPMGLEELTSYKYKVRGSGQIR